MKKEKGNLTLKQLEDRKRLVTLIGFALTVILIITIMVILYVFEKDFSTVSPKVMLVLVTICILPICFIMLINEEYDKQIELKEKQLKVKTIKSLAQKGNLKECVFIKEREIIEYILLVGIKKIEIESIEYKGSRIVPKNMGFQANIYLKNGECLKSISFSDKKVIELLNLDLEKYILNLLITDINLSKEPEGNTEVTIEGKDECFYYKDIFKDDDLLDIFEFKEE